MTFYLKSDCQLALLSLCCVLITVGESEGTFVPGRCLCPQTQRAVRGPLKEFIVYPKSPRCDKVTVIVILKTNIPVCLNPETPMGKHLIRCWNRAHKLGRDVKLCLKRRSGKRRGGPRQRLRQRSRGQSSNASLSHSQ